jgi:AraC-like DNA-binding protein
MAIPSTIFELSTDGVPPAKRFELWRDTALRRLDVEKVSDTLPFEGRLRRVSGTNIEFWDHRTDPLWVNRSRTRCRMDGRGDIGVSLVLDCENATVQNIRDLSLKSGDIYLIDYAEPVRAVRPRHRELALMLPREDVTALLGDDLSALAGQRLPLDGVGALLRSHMQRTADRILDLSSEARTSAIDAAYKLAFVVLQSSQHGYPDPDQVGDGLYIGARAVIKQHCIDPTLSPEAVARQVGCSRASLYRLFARHGQTVVTTIWLARLDRAWDMVATPVDSYNIAIGTIAFRCGFTDQATFSRMFKRRYGLSPRDVRALASASNTK